MGISKVMASWYHGARQVLVIAQPDIYFIVKVEKLYYIQHLLCISNTDLRLV